jgi:hypothetical protein
MDMTHVILKNCRVAIPFREWDDACAYYERNVDRVDFILSDDMRFRNPWEPAYADINGRAYEDD